MVQLSETWFVEGNIDFESKKYTILAYLQRVNSHFKENKLYPELSDIIFHYNNIISFKNNKKYLQQQFPKRLTGVQIQKLEMLYEELISDNELMAELEDITYYAMKNMKKTIDIGANIYEEVEKKMYIEPIGLLPLDNREGYFFLAHMRVASTFSCSSAVFPASTSRWKPGGMVSAKVMRPASMAGSTCAKFIICGAVKCGG